MSVVTKLVLPAVLAVLGLLTLAACGDDDGQTPATSTGDETATRSVTIVAKDTLRFEPSEIHMKVGETVKVTLDNSDGAILHDFTVEDMPVHDVHAEGAMHMGDEHMEMAALHVAADAHEMGTIEFTPTDPGEYEFHCSVTGHADAGMTGKIIVEQ